MAEVLSVPSKQLRVTELDFEQIKSNLRNHFKRTDSKFKDWDFDGSGLSALLDILAYNTYYNAVLAHTTFNESFIDSAQLRGNVVSQAKLLGYLPRSVRSARAYISLDSQEQVDKYDVYTTQVEGLSLTFLAGNDANGTTDSQVELIEGVRKVSQFTVDESLSKQLFVIDDVSIDTSTLIVRVKDTGVTTSATEFLLFTSLADVDATSPVYFLSQNVYGKYELSFGDDIIGRKLTGSNIVELEYISSNGVNGNGAQIFERNGTQITSLSPASGGADLESVESIRVNAPNSFITQNRAVTANDYKALILQNFSVPLDAINVWGGEDEQEYHADSQEYLYSGKAYICIKPSTGATLTDEQKLQIENILENRRVFTIKTVFVDPDFTYLYFDVFFKYVSGKTAATEEQLESLVRTALETYGQNRLVDFTGVFRYSELLRSIDSSEPAIVNSLARVYYYKKMTRPAGNEGAWESSFASKVYGSTEGATPLLKSTGWVKSAVTYYLKDGPWVGDLRKMYVSEDQVSSVNESEDTEVGIFDASTGIITIDLSLLTTGDFMTGGTQIEIHGVPASDDVAPIRNQLLVLDMNRMIIAGSPDEVSQTGNPGASTYVTQERVGNRAIV